jgi:hypothetical protein
VTKGVEQVKEEVGEVRVQLLVGAEEGKTAEVKEVETRRVLEEEVIV